jgi:adenosylmethionine---8-amino-7-oxononanoate aminotransferase
VPTPRPLDLDFRHLWLPISLGSASNPGDFLISDRASGSKIIDANGRYFIDATSSFGSSIHGYRSALINQAIKNQMHRIADSSFISTTTLALAEHLVEIAPPGLQRVLFSPTGPDSVENAIHIARYYHRIRNQPRRENHLVFEPSRTNLHASTTQTEARSSDPRQVVINKLSIAVFNSVFDMHRDNLSAVIIEPGVHWRSGVQLYPPGLISNISQRCREHGIVLIADESTTGFGRTGPMFGCETERVTPDLLCCGSALTGGHLPLGVTLATEAIFATIAENNNGDVAHLEINHAANPLACAAAIASLEIFDRENIIAVLPGKIQYFKRSIESFVAPLSAVSAIRQCGMMVGIELRERESLDATNRTSMGERVCTIALEEGLLLQVRSSVVILMPPLSIEPGEIDQLVKIVASAIARASDSENDTPFRSSFSPGRSPRPARPHGLILLGTDTDVGKTTVGRAILRMAARAGHPVVPVKPIESGCNPTPVDAEALRRASQLDLPLERICPFPFAAPVAPAIAAEMIGQTLTLDQLVAACNRARPHVNPHQPILVETAGGLLSPLTATETNVDLAAKLGLPILLVARNGLGTINHTALAIGELRRRGLPVAALILVDTDGKLAPDRDTNAHAIARQTGIAAIGIFPFADNPGSRDEDDQLALALENNCDTRAIWRALAPDS